MASFTGKIVGPAGTKARPIIVKRIVQGYTNHCRFTVECDGSDPDEVRDLINQMVGGEVEIKITLAQKQLFGGKEE